MSGLWVDAANVFVGEFGAGFVSILSSFLVMSLVLVVADGVLGVPGCFGRRAARKKEEHTVLMRQVLRDFGASHVQSDQNG